MAVAQSLMKFHIYRFSNATGVKIQGQTGGMRRASDAEVSSTERLSPRLYLRRSSRVGAWNAMSLSDEVRDERITDLAHHAPR